MSQHLMSSRQNQPQSTKNSALNHEHSPQGHPGKAQAVNENMHGIHLNKKISGNKHKRTGRDKSYDLYS